MYNFIKENGEQSTIRRPFNVNGEFVRKSYEQIINTPSNASETNDVIPLRERKKYRPPANHKKPQTIQFDKKLYFEAALKNDLQTLVRMMITLENINCTDRFGWTALMVAACEGSFNTFKYLYWKNADTSVADKSGNTAMSLAKHKNHSNIVQFIEREQKNTDTGSICISSSDDDEAEPPEKDSNDEFFCATCDCNVRENERKKHITSTLHRFSEKNPHKFARHFGIPDSNVGFQMMLRQGWNRESGLGPQREGHLYPVKTTLRKPRSGLGVKQKTTAKVTHFLPFDSRAVQANRPPILTAKTGKQLKREKARNGRKERRLRNLLS